MKPDWDKLGDLYADSSSVLIADVDCTAEGEDLCKKYEVSGYPTLKYFKDGDMEGENYSGGRDFSSLEKFVSEELEVKCIVSDPKECSEQEKEYINKMNTKSSEENLRQLQRLESMKDNSMKAELKSWLIKRLRILKQLTEAKSGEL